MVVCYARQNMVNCKDIYIHMFTVTLFTIVTVSALAGTAQWIERGPANQRVAGLIPSEGTCLGCGARSPVEDT